MEDYIQGCGRAGRDGLPAKCVAFLAPSDVPGLRSQIYGVTPSRTALEGFVETAFSDSANMCTQDAALYMSLYDLSREFDIGDVQLRLAISHLVQNEYIEELTPIFGCTRAGMLDEIKFASFMGAVNNSAAATNATISASTQDYDLKANDGDLSSAIATISASTQDYDFKVNDGDLSSASATISASIQDNDFEVKGGDLSSILDEYDQRERTGGDPSTGSLAHVNNISSGSSSSSDVSHTNSTGAGISSGRRIIKANFKLVSAVVEFLRQQKMLHPRRKYADIQSISLADQLQCTPAQVSGAIRFLIESGMCKAGGVSRVHSRFRILPRLQALLDQSGYIRLESHRPPVTAVSVEITEPVAASRKGGVRGVSGKTSTKSVRPLSRPLPAADFVIELAEALYLHSQEVQRRGLARADEIVALFRQCSVSCSDDNESENDMWERVGAYFNEESDIHAVTSMPVADMERGRSSDGTISESNQGDEEEDGDVIGDSLNAIRQGIDSPLIIADDSLTIQEESLSSFSTHAAGMVGDEMSSQVALGRDPLPRLSGGNALGELSAGLGVYEGRELPFDEAGWAQVAYLLCYVHYSDTSTIILV